MSKKTKKGNYKVMAVVICLALAIGLFQVISIGKAQEAKSDVAELTELSNSLKGNSDAFVAGIKYLATKSGEMLGGVTWDDEIFQNDVTVKGDLTVDGYISNTIDLELNFDQATTTAVGNTTLVLGKWQNTTGKSLVCSLGGEGVVADIQGVIPWKADLNVATTTCLVAGTTCGDGTTSFTATTSKGLLTETTATSTAVNHVLNSDDDEGDYTLEQYVVADQEWFISTLTWEGYEFSTSTLGTTASTGNTAVSYDNFVKINCKYRDEAK